MSSNSRRAAALGLLLLVPPLARADPSTAAQPTLGLRWTDSQALSPTTEREFDAQLAARLGHPAFVATTEGPTLSVTWLGSPERCRVELVLARAAGVEGTRIIESPSGDCLSLLPALLTVSALLVESYEDAQSQEAPPPPSSPAPPTPDPLPPAPVERSASRPRVWVSLGGALSSGLVPRLEIGPAAVAAWSPVSHLRLGVAGSVFVAHDFGDGPGLSLNHQRAALLLCGMPLEGSFGLGLCGNLGFHHFRASGTSLARPDARSVGTWSVGADVRAEWRLTRRLWWVAHAGADVATQPLYFYYFTASGEPRNLFQQRRISPNLLLALTLEFP